MRSRRLNWLPHSIHVTMVGGMETPSCVWSGGIFSGSSASDTQQQHAAIVEKLHAKTDQLVVERDFLVKASGW